MTQRSLDAAAIVGLLADAGLVVQLDGSLQVQGSAFQQAARQALSKPPSTEQMVNLIIGQRHPDTAALRRYLVDDEFLSREAGEYWRSGGSTPSVLPDEGE